MTGHANVWRRCALMMAGIGLIASGPVAAAERGGGIRQVPLIPPSSMKSSNGSMPAPSRPESTQASAPPDPRQPADSVVITSGGARYVISAGRWYEQRGDKLRAISPPQGVLVPELPRGYSMRWVGGVPYFYADGLYYLWRERKRSYEVLPAPPAGDAGQRSEAPRPDAGQEPVQPP